MDVIIDVSSDDTSNLSIRRKEKEPMLCAMETTDFIGGQLP